jgi:hypothetical protein
VNPAHPHDESANGGPSGPSAGADLSPVELLLYAPLGLLLKGVENTRAEYARRAPMARLMGKLIIDQQRKKKRAQSVSIVKRGPNYLAPRPSTSGVPLTPVHTEPSNAAEDAPETVVLADLPIDGYDTLPGRSLLELFGGLTPDQLRSVLAYETTHRQRATVMNRLIELIG